MKSKYPLIRQYLQNCWESFFVAAVWLVVAFLDRGSVGYLIFGFCLITFGVPALAYLVQHVLLKKLDDADE